MENTLKHKIKKMNFKKEFRKLNEMSDEEVEKVYKNTNYNYLKVIANIKNLEQ